MTRTQAKDAWWAGLREIGLARLLRWLSGAAIMAFTVGALVGANTALKGVDAANEGVAANRAANERQDAAINALRADVGDILLNTCLLLAASGEAVDPQRCRTR